MNSTASNPCRVVIFGATSRIAFECARALIGMLAPRPVEFRLVGRNHHRLDACAADLRLRGAAASFACADFLDPLTNWDALMNLPDGSPPNICLVAAGDMPPQEEMETEGVKLARMVDLNLTATARICLAARRVMGGRGGTLAVLGSVAGDRGKASNYLYGATKAAVETLLDGLDHSLGPRSPLRLVLLKPGFVESPMTAGLPPTRLMTSAEKAGALVARAILRGRRVAYIPGWWRWILLIIRRLPRAVFLRVKI